MKCLGQLCPPSLEALNTPKFVIRAGIIPYTAPSKGVPGRILLGIKEGKYTDFGGGCKGSKLERPFDCAVREMREEIGPEIVPNLNNITHIFVSGKTKPHQIILFVRMDDLYVPRNIPKEELEGVRMFTFFQIKSMDRRLLQNSLKSIYPDLVATL